MRTLIGGNSVAAVPILNPAKTIKRIASVDVYRGFVMVLMMGEVLSFKSVAGAFPDNSFWQYVSFNQTHVPWVGCSLHDIIQPSFTFLVGVVLPFSVAGRLNKGQKFSSLLRHTIMRSIILICLGIFLRSIHSGQTNFTFEDTLTQIGLGYSFLFILSFYSQRVWLIALIVILVGYWLAFALYPLPAPTFDYAAAGVSSDNVYNLHGIAAHWNKNTNVAYSFDRWFLNLFPREKPFLNNNGGYSTLSFIPTLGTMIFGLFAGSILKDSNNQKEKMMIFIITGTSLVFFSIVLHLTGINPIVKKIWTPAWTIFSGGICFLLLAFFYGVIDVAGEKKWSFVFMIAGVNSIAAYVIADGGMRNYISNSLYTHLGRNFDKIFGSDYETLVLGGTTLFLEWMILYWMYSKKIFIKI
jgi:predicted acyltransferase